MYTQAGLPGDPVIRWPPSLGATHERDLRRYAQVRPFMSPPIFELAPQTVWLPGENRRALLAHEVGHVLDPHGGEDEADAAARRVLGVRIGYDHRWPGKGLQVARNPGPEERKYAVARLERALAPAPFTGRVPPRESFELMAAGETSLVLKPEGVQERPAITRALGAMLSRPPLEGLASPDAWEDLLAAAGLSADVFVVDAHGQRWKVEEVDFDFGGETGRLKLRHVGPYGVRWVRLHEAYGRMIPIVVYKPSHRHYRNPPVGDRGLRELERRWQESGAEEDHGRYLGALMRAGRINPEKLWLLGRDPSTPERFAIQHAFGTEIPLAGGLFSNITLRGVREIGGVYPLSGDQAIWEWLSLDLVQQPSSRERVAVREEAWLVVMEQVRRLLLEHELLRSDHFRLPGMIEDLKKGIEAIRSGRLSDTSTNREYLSMFVAEHDHAHARQSLAWALNRVIEQQTFSEWLEVPQEVVEEARDRGHERGYLDEEIAEILSSSWGQLGLQAEPEEVGIAARPDGLRWARVTPSGGEVAERFYAYVLESLRAWLRDQPLPPPPPRQDRGPDFDAEYNPVRRNPQVRNPSEWKTPPPCDPSLARNLSHAVPLNSLKGKRVRIHVNLHNGCYVVSHAGRVAGYTRSLKLKDVEPKVSMAGWQACNTTKVRNVHAYLEGTLVSVSAGKPAGGGWEKITYRCKDHGPFFYFSDTGKTFEGSSEAVFINKGGNGFAQIEVLAKGRAAKKNPNKRCCRHPGGACSCGAVDAWWREAPEGCGC